MRVIINQRMTYHEASSGAPCLDSTLRYHLLEDIFEACTSWC
jgi:hypothetical protein